MILTISIELSHEIKCNGIKDNYEILFWIDEFSWKYYDFFIKIQTELIYNVVSTLISCSIRLETLELNLPAKTENWELFAG